MPKARYLRVKSVSMISLFCPKRMESYMTKSVLKIRAKQLYLFSGLVFAVWSPCRAKPKTLKFELLISL